MTTETRPALRMIRGGRTDDDGRHSVDVYDHNTGKLCSVVWTLPQLLTAIRRRRPREPGDPNWTFSIGRRRSLAITTDGRGRFHAQRTVKAADGLVAEMTVLGDLALKDVERLAHAFYAGACDLPCHSRASF